ncbi:MAG: hypothetical protein P4L65_11360 [Legionella sp.]|nr:hypothetical protein [Legionella sp.]
MPLQNLWQNEPLKTEQEIADLVQIISGTLHVLAKKGDFLPKRAAIFHLTSLPHISIHSYLERYVKYLMLDEAELIASFIILDRYITKFPQQSVSYTNIHQLLAAIIQVVHKISVDKPYKSSYYAQLAGVSTKQMVDLERNLLFDLDFDLFITPKTYLKYKQALIDEARKRDALECRIKPYALSMSQSDLEMLRLLNESEEYDEYEEYERNKEIAENYYLTQDTLYYAQLDAAHEEDIMLTDFFDKNPKYDISFEQEDYENYLREYYELAEREFEKTCALDLELYRQAEKASEEARARAEEEELLLEKQQAQDNTSDEDLSLQQQEQDLLLEAETDKFATSTKRFTRYNLFANEKNIKPRKDKHTIHDKRNKLLEENAPRKNSRTIELFNLVKFEMAQYDELDEDLYSPSTSKDTTK